MRHPDDDLLWALLEGELSAREHALLSKRLDEDLMLRRRLDQISAMHTLLKEALPALDTREQTERIVDRVRAARKKK